MVVQAGKCWCISACPTVLWCWSSGRRPYQAMKKRFENLRKTFLKTTGKKIKKTNPYFLQKLHHATWQRNRRVWCLLSFTGRVWPPQPQLKNGCKVRSSMKGGKRGKSFNKRNRWSNFFLRSKRWEWLIPLCWLVLRNEIQYIYIYTHISLGLLYINVFEVQRSSNFQVGSLKVSVDTPPVFLAVIWAQLAPGCVLGIVIRCTFVLDKYDVSNI